MGHNGGPAHGVADPSTVASTCARRRQIYVFMHSSGTAQRKMAAWGKGERGRGRRLFVLQTETDGVLGGRLGQGGLIGDRRD